MEHIYHDCGFYKGMEAYIRRTARRSNVWLTNQSVPQADGTYRFYEKEGYIVRSGEHLTVKVKDNPSDYAHIYPWIESAYLNRVHETIGIERMKRTRIGPEVYYNLYLINFDTAKNFVQPAETRQNFLTYVDHHVWAAVRPNMKSTTTDVYTMTPHGRQIMANVLDRECRLVGTDRRKVEFGIYEKAVKEHHMNEIHLRS